MTDLNSMKWGVLFSSIGVVMGWFLNQLSQWWRFRKEDKRTLKQVLYNLLEVHHLLSRFDIDEPAGIITHNLFSQLPADQNTEENKLLIQKLILREVTVYFDKTTTVELRTIENKYQGCISDLSKIDPLKAYYLSDKTKIFDNIKLIEGWIDNVYERHPGEVEIQDTTKNEMITILRPNIVTDSLKHLRQEMTSIAWKINPIIWLRVKNMLDKNNYKNTSEWERKANEIVFRIAKHIKTQLTPDSIH